MVWEGEVKWKVSAGIVYPDWTSTKTNNWDELIHKRTKIRIEEIPDES